MSCLQFSINWFPLFQRSTSNFITRCQELRGRLHKPYFHAGKVRASQLFAISPPPPHPFDLSYCASPRSPEGLSYCIEAGLHDLAEPGTSFVYLFQASWEMPCSLRALSPSAHSSLPVSPFRLRPAVRLCGIEAEAGHISDGPHLPVSSKRAASSMIRAHICSLI
jgi:hypothetical protein